MKMMISVSGLKLTVKMLDVCLCLFNLDKKIESSNKGRRLAPSSPTVVVELAMQQSLLVSWVFLPLLVVVMPQIRSRKAGVKMPRDATGDLWLILALKFEMYVIQNFGAITNLGLPQSILKHRH